MNVGIVKDECTKTGSQLEEAVKNTKIDHHEYARILAEFNLTPEEQHRIIRKVDRRVVVTLGVLFCVSLIDRVNLGSANIAGMGQDLELTGDRYAIVTLVFFITYTLGQQPSTIILREIGPRKFITMIVILWGAVTLGIGFTTHWEQLAGIRVILGLFESGLFPGSVYLLSTWYTRYEVGVRYSVFYTVGTVASAFSGILAYGLTQMNGLANLAGWRWIFIIEGLATCLLGSVAYLLLVEFPESKTDSWSFLDQRSRDWIMARVNADRGDAVAQPFHLRKFFSPASDWKIWATGILLCNLTTLNYALAFFLPIILTTNMGFSVAAAQCLTAPPYIAAAFLMYGSAHYSDKLRLRAPFLILNMLIALVGLPIMGFASSAAVRYFGVFLVTMGTLSTTPLVFAYQANNIRGHWKRAFCSSTTLAFGGIGGIIGGVVFRPQDAPYFRTGLIICMALLGLNLIIVVCLTAAYRTLNGKADRGDMMLENYDGESPPDFRYTY
ncbi:major facilitator superfamily domain-containing protein [Microdochium trichocladiopsis]|uniref:Major facilitator superfamily domain-containing protein n=1 Tax=Microdochium trichocladiopsis TaxID=1682393 RepID=A0A9P9BPX8_9PEZI|nr:major facilitator superfamily domain-containing protein [Microdochium trichocladiopsis]KAH7029739.1 major facilitator superfamily domain-containing protein [Microdochium trichocladiopsis]